MFDYDENNRAEEIYQQNLADGYWRDKHHRYRHITTLDSDHLRAIDGLLQRVGDPYRFRDKIRRELLRRAVGESN